MKVFYRLLFILFSLVLLAGCRQRKKKVSLSGDEPVKVSDFIDFFKPLNLPFQYADSNLQKTKKENDSTLIGYKVFTQFIPDSVVTKVYGKGVKPKIYAMGKIPVPGAETYLLVKTIASGKKCVYLFSFDRKQAFAAFLVALRPDQNVATLQSVTIDRRYTITKTVQRRNADASLSEGKDVYAFNAEARAFHLIMTEALDDKLTELINPIDTLPRKHKFSADYRVNKMNLVSIRDGRHADRLNFFIHFEKDNGKCSGELKGEAIIRSGTVAEYNKDGDPCKLKFIFSSSSVTLKEVEGCGSYRPLNCSFNGSFPRKRESKPKQTIRKPVKK